MGTTRLTMLAIAIAAGLAAAPGAWGQSRQIPAPPQDRPVVIHSAIVHTVADGTIEDGYVVFDGGVIRDVGRGAAPDVADATRVNAEGMHVYPGLIAADTRLGLTETGAVDVTNDHTEYGRVAPEVRAAVAVNPDSDHIPVARANGILTAMAFPGGGVVSGRCSLLRLDGWTWEDMAIDAEAGLVVNWPRMMPRSAPWITETKAQQRKAAKESLEQIDRLFDEAEAYVAARDNDPAMRTDLRFEAMRPVLSGDDPVFVRASSAAQIESAVAWGQRRGLEIIIVGGAHADRVLPLLAKHDVAVIVTGLHRLPSARHDDYDRPFRLPLALHEAGVRFAIASRSGDSSNVRNLSHHAATAAAYGLDPAEALRAVTMSPAEIFGVDDRLGSIEAGKAATIIVTTGDPLEITTDTLVAYIDGRRIDLGNRQKTLYAKYREKYRQLGLIE